MNEKIKNACSVTGHRNIPSNITAEIKCRLKDETLALINNGCHHFISGFAAGVDLIFAEIITEFKELYKITLEAAIPYKGRLNTPDKDFQRLIKLCDKVTILSDEYNISCYMKRNRYMVDSSKYVIAVYDGRNNGGTAATVSYAKERGKTLRLIEI